MRTFDSIWSELKSIAEDHLNSKQPVLTLDRNTQNEITKVTEDFIERDSKGKKTGAANRVRRSDFERIYNALQDSGGSVVVQTIGTLYFAYALFNRLAEVTFTENPLTLHWDTSKERAYYIIGSGYGEYAEDSVLEQMIQKSVVSTGFYGGSLSSFYRKPMSEIKQYLLEEGEEPKSYNALSKFLQLKIGDVIAVKTSGSPKGTQPHLKIAAFAIVVERNGLVYSFDHERLGHCVNVEFVETELDLDFSIGGYGRTIHKIQDEGLIDLLFKNYHEHDRALISSKIRRRRRAASSKKKTGQQPRRGSAPYVVNLKHNEIQERFKEYLIKVYGERNVSMEKDWVDITVDMGSHVTLYEVKPFDAGEDCLVEALGQILSYGFHLDDVRDKKYVIVGPSPLDKDEMAFLRHLKESLRLSIDYQAFPI